MIGGGYRKGGAAAAEGELTEFTEDESGVGVGGETRLDGFDVNELGGFGGWGGREKGGGGEAGVGGPDGVDGMGEGKVGQ